LVDLEGRPLEAVVGNEHAELAVEANTLADTVSKGPRGADSVAPSGAARARRRGAVDPL